MVGEGKIVWLGESGGSAHLVLFALKPTTKIYYYTAM
jgi:hypothetical protein